MLNLPRSPRPETAPRGAGPAPRSPRPGSLWRRVPVVAGLMASFLAAAGCSMRSDLEFTTLMNEVPATRAIMVPPPGGPGVVSVLERRYLNGVSQEIALSTAAEGRGQNTFWIRLVNDPRALTENDDSLSIGRLDPLDIYNEINERLPGINMQTSNYFVQNKYGPFGYAVGRSGAGDLCLYAWQQIEPTENAIFMTSGTVSVRMRVCQANATEEQLLRVMYGYSISAYFKSDSWNPYGTPPPPSPQLGQIDAPIYPLGSANPDAVVPPRVLPQAQAQTTVTAATVRTPAVRRTTTVRRTTVTRPAAPPVSSAPAAGYPVVPPPPP
ncbi:cellulose biosynthesis protein BcsN [Microvirga pudoricolor]|uniref:cellulose biosynthesis protein BcsN n=1 Tax=Microvirga pudoricolor TaxID=2778729 RepID=UPI00194DDA9F|nr:cellulose biosynthesis protein BcsN [Microvirga pudoricolor]MBM6594809.1 cellulose biosynthesis protein BcsN [Microvirga pudoricolor]